VNLCIRLVTDPHPETWLRLVIVLVILIVAAVPAVRSGWSPQDLLTFFLGAGVAGAQAARPLPAALTRGRSRW
jgi:hypothetical protein